MEIVQVLTIVVTMRYFFQDKAMSFAFVDGRIESICPRSDDETWAVNIRRGILSALQNTMNKLQGVSKDRETDVAGNCPVKYEVRLTTPSRIRST